MKAAADKLLKDAVSKGDVPGVVATRDRRWRARPTKVASASGCWARRPT